MKTGLPRLEHTIKVPTTTYLDTPRIDRDDKTNEPEDGRTRKGKHAIKERLQSVCHTSPLSIKAFKEGSDAEANLWPVA